MEYAYSLGQMLNHCAHLTRQYMDRQLRAYQVTPVQSFALIYLHQQEGVSEVTQRDLERELRLRPSTVNGIVSRLEEKGYIARRTSPTDGRCRLVSLTDAGRGKLDAFRVTLEEVNRRFGAILTAEEQEQLGGLLSRIITDLENEVNKV